MLIAKRLSAGLFLKAATISTLFLLSTNTNGNAQDFSSTKAPATTYHGAEAYKNFSAISTMILPEGWYSSPLSIKPEYTLQRLKPQEKMKSAVDFFLREERTPPNTASAAEMKARLEILAGPEHALTQKEQESIPYLLHDFNSKSATPGEIKRCRTLKAKGLRGIFIEFTYPAVDFFDEQKGLKFMFDTSGDAKTFTSYEYVAEVGDFDKYLPPYQKAIDSLKFK